MEEAQPLRLEVARVMGEPYAVVQENTFLKIVEADDRAHVASHTVSDTELIMRREAVSPSLSKNSISERWQ